jgi:DNA-binding transcriptional MerR regulator
MSTFEAAGAPEQAWKVGALAKAAGLTVRALHYYDQIGLLTPSRRTAADHRLYDGGDVARLYRISLLRRLGFPLEQVRAGDQVIGLHPSAEGFRPPGALGAVTGITVDDADAHYARSVQAGAEIVEEPIDQPYGIREYGARDPEGQLWYFHSPLG